VSLLRIDNLDVRHGLLQAVRRVSFDVARGDVLALVGANGAGKTTLLRALAGAHLPHAGRIHFRDADVTAMPDHKRVKLGIALVPEGRQLFAEMTVAENLLLAQAAGRTGFWNVETVLAAFPHLKRLQKAKAGTLSGGEQQATAIGRSLITNPDLLLLDEISLGLSPLAVDLVYHSLQSLLSAGTTIIIVEQDLKRVFAFARRIICMLEGQLVLDGAAADLTRERITEAYFGLRRDGLQGAPA
jgi:branched-chain amino acid transport system ATP-binding protein